MMEDFEKRQVRFSKEYKTIKEQKRIEVHLASVETDEEKRLSMNYFPERQNVQLARIFRLRDPNLILIFVSAIDLSP
jgi:IQ domain-containing protein H